VAIDRSIWTETFDSSQFPTFPCPHCSRGRAAFDKTTLRNEEPRYSKSAQKDDGWEPEWIVERFSAHLRCTEQTCGEIVVISGDTVWIETMDEELGWSYTSALRPK
jgi:hypothetical protein